MRARFRRHRRPVPAPTSRYGDREARAGPVSVHAAAVPVPADTCGGFGNRTRNAVHGRPAHDLHVDRVWRGLLRRVAVSIVNHRYLKGVAVLAVPTPRTGPGGCVVRHRQSVHRRTVETVACPVVVDLEVAAQSLLVLDGDRAEGPQSRFSRPRGRSRPRRARRRRCRCSRALPPSRRRRGGAAPGLRRHG
jgi:hypothetical protein